MSADGHTTDCDECGTLLAKTDDARFTGDDADDPVWLCDDCIEDRCREQHQRDGCPRCDRANSVVQAENDTVTCKDCEITWIPEDLPRLTSIGFDFYRGDTVVVDWRDGMGAEEIVEGEVEDISMSAREIVVSVIDRENDEFARGKSYCAAPEWVMETK